MNLPMYTNVSDIDVITSILSSKIKEISEDEGRKINGQVFTENSLSTFEFIGLIQKNSAGIKLTELGRNYANANDDKEKVEILKKAVKKINIYDTTLEYMHHNQKLSPTKTEMGSYWNEFFNDKINDLSEDEISSSVVFFLKLCERMGLGKFINAGRGRETRIDFDNVKIAEYITKKLTQNDVNKVDIVKKSTGKEMENILQEPVPEVKDEKISELSPSSLRALGKLQIGLSWKDLDSDGAKKLIIEKLDDLQQENTVLKAKVERLYEIDKGNAVLETKIKTLSNVSLIRTSVNSIGGIILGASFTISDIAPKLIGILMGVILITLSILYREKSKEDKAEKSK